MSSNVVEFDALTRIRRETNANQVRATSAEHSAWVSANAGAGKTYVLVRRVLSLLLAGSSPETILCLTFTKAAAAEMANRLIAELGGWATASDVWLQKTIENLNGRPATISDIELARRLFAQVIETPGGLRIMTIHAFCDGVLRRFPLEAGVSPSFSLLTDEDAAMLRRDATDAVLDEASRQPDAALGRALSHAIAYANEEQFDGLLRAVLSNREDLKALIQQSGAGDPFETANRNLRLQLGVGLNERRQDVLDEQWAVCREEWLAEAIERLSSGKSTDQELARKLAAARLAETALAAVGALAAAFLTSEGKVRSDKFVTKIIRDRCPDLAQNLQNARDRFAILNARLSAVTAADATDALLRLGDAILSHYEAAKADRSCLDFDDLITKTVSLLTADGGAGWVLYRLDGGVDHILVDEAQDTSPLQWRVITELTSEFYSGEGARENARTVFAVGDEKQSIYSFQGAEPKRFAEMGAMFRRRAEASGLAHHEAPLFLSFRSTEPVLRAVDLVFADERRTPGLHSGGGPVRHYANREREGGLVEIWPTIKAEKAETGDPWTPLDDSRSLSKPCDLLAARIADRIREWLDDGELLASRGRPIRPGDILILVKKREPFARPMIRALKDRGIPVAGTDRMRLTAELAIQDLMSIGAFVLLPDDDLNLACLLKSPAFDFTDDDLFDIAHGREGTLWAAFRAKAAQRPQYAQAVERLQKWLNQADQIPPFEFYVERLEREDLNTALLARLGAESADAIGEFLDLALSYEQNAVPSLQGFLHWLSRNDVEVKRDMEQGRDEVRVMTVHGAKGLEADIVFLPDTCSTKGANRTSLLVFDAEGARPGSARQFLWTPGGGSRIETAQRVRDLMKAGEREEYHRLLYVAMTRARDRLYVTGFESLRGRDSGCWYDLILSGLQGVASEEPNGVLRLQEASRSALAAGSSDCPPTPRPAPPDWIAAPAPPEPLSAEFVAVTSLGGAGDRPGPQSSLKETARAAAMERGVTVHKLLELLPGAPPKTWSKVAKQFLATFGANIPSSERDELVKSTLKILRSSQFSDLWGPQSRAEVELAIELPPLTPGAPLLKLSGRIDRLVVRDDTVCIVDYKTGDAPAHGANDAPRAFLRQLAAYRLAVKSIFPGKSVRAALLWTSVPKLVEVPEDVLEALSVDGNADMSA